MGNRDKMDKTPESLRKFSGNPLDFVEWAQHMIDHMGRVHPTWRPVLEWVGKSSEDLSFARLNKERLGPYGEHAGELAVKFEQILVDWLPS